MIQKANGKKLVTPIKTGRPPFKPTPEQHALVAQLASFGVKHDEIATVIGVGSVNTLKKYFQEELETGAVKANARVATALFSAAVNGNITAQIFWLKTRARWIETDRHEHTGVDGETLQLVFRAPGSELNGNGNRPTGDAPDAVHGGNGHNEVPCTRLRAPVGQNGT